MNKKNLLFLLIISIFILIIRTPSHLEPYYYGDEMIYLTLGNSIKNGLNLYKDVVDNKTPGIYILASWFNSLLLFRLATTFWVIISSIFFYLLTKKLFINQKKIQIFSVLIFATLMSIPLFEGNTPNAEHFFIGLNIIAILFALQKKHLFIIFSGITLGISALFKIPALSEILVIGTIWLITDKSIIKTSIKSLFLILTIIAIIGTSIFWYWQKGSGQDYIQRAFLQNSNYISSFRPNDKQKTFIEKNLPLIERSTVAIIGFFIVLLISKKTSFGFTIGAVWAISSLFSATLSERPYPHYLLQVAPSIAIMMAILVFSTKKDHPYPVFALLAIFSIPYFSKFYEYKTGLYFQNASNLLTNKVSTNTYLSKYSNDVVRNYEISKFILSISQSTDKIFVWGDAPPIYAQTKRSPAIKFVANYHITDWSNNDEVINMLSISKPKIIVIGEEGEKFQKLEQFCQTYYNLVKEIKNMTGPNANIWLKKASI